MIPDHPEAETIGAEINAAARIIGDISTGIYRSPANALKELVSNSFDAGATEVVISTDHPGFSSVSCFDNGPGISIEKLQEIFRYIGGSDKRRIGETGPYGRPVIGRIGIGILAMSQISKRFVIISSREGEKFRIEVEVNIEDFETTDSARLNLGEGSIGQYSIFRIPESPEEHYTIVATPAGSDIIRANLGQGRTPRQSFVRKSYESDTFEAFVRKIGEVKHRETLSDYEVFLWELAALCPVPYFEEGPVKGWSEWDHIKERLDSYNFKVVVDGYELRKPVLLPSGGELRQQGEDFQVYPFSYTDGDADPLKFEGYIFHQRTQISPPELQGLLVRIRNVGIGSYEADMLKYPINLGPMVHGMSGEVYVDIGLEAALNIDRNSFNETHPHFIILKDVVYQHLGIPGKSGIARDIRQRSSERQRSLQKDRTFESLERLVQRLERATRESWDLFEDQGMDNPLALELSDRFIVVNLDHDTVPSSASAKREFFRVCLIARLAETMAPPGGEGDSFVGWLRRL